MHKHLYCYFMVGILALHTSCAEESSTDGNENASTTEALPTGALAINGDLANGEDASATEILSGQTVSIVRNDGAVVGEATSEKDGTFEAELPPGALVIDTSFSLIDGESDDQPTEPPTTADFSYHLEVKVPDDGEGKAIGIRRRLDIGASNVSAGKLDTGTNKLKEVSAIIGSVSFADPAITVENVDIFIPGKQFFVRTGDDGAYALLFVPPGDYQLRFVKGNYIKDVDVSVTAGKTLQLGTVEIGSDDRNPARLESVLVGTWTTSCYYTSGAVDPDNPVTGVATINALDDVSITEDSCVLRTVAGTVVAPASLQALGDGAVIVKDIDSDFYYNVVSDYTNDRIVFVPDPNGLPGFKQIEIWERQ